MVRRQSRFVFRVAYAILRNAHDAEDAVQETFLKLYRNGGWRGVENERAFLARVAWRVAVDRGPRAPQASSSQVELETIAEPAGPQPGPEQTVVMANQHALVHALIDALPDDLRVPLVLSASEELNSREIAAVLGIPEGTVRTRLQRARQILRLRLAQLNLRKQEGQHA